jgi:AraC family transcriptional regulator
MVQRPTSIVETKQSLDKSFDRNEDFECLFRRDIEFRHETIIQKYSTKVRSLREENKEHSQHRLKKAIDYINDNLAEDLSLRDISSIIHVSPYYFSRMFKRSTGLSPHQYLLRRRIEVAKQLLLRKNSSILEISQQVGFASQSHFIKVFRKYTGATPKNYREEID